MTLPLAELTVRLLVLTLVVPEAGAVRTAGVKLTAETGVVGTPESITKLLVPLNETEMVFELNAVLNCACKALAMSDKLVVVKLGVIVCVALPMVTDIEVKSDVLGLRLAKLTPDKVAV